MAEPEPAASVDPSSYTHKLGKYLFNMGDDPLGTGGYGVTYMAVNAETGEQVAMKMALEQAQQTSAELREVVLQACLSHEFIVPIKDVVYGCVAPTPRNQAAKPRLAVVMEVVGGGELFDEVLNDGGLAEEKAKNFFRQILFAMAYCHNRGIAHRDMKLENLLLTGDKSQCKVCDFGLAKNLSESAFSTIIGTAKYVAPEVLGGAEYDGFKADIWSCGVCLYCMIECRFPFTEAGNDGVGGHGVKAATPENLRMMKRLKDAEYTLKPGRSPEFVAFLARLLHPDPTTRYSAAEALQDPFMLSAEFTAEGVAATLAAMDTSGAPVPGNYVSKDAWLAQVAVLTGAAGEGGEGEDDEEDGI